MPKKKPQLSIDQPEIQNLQANPQGVMSYPNGTANYEEVKRLAHEYWRARGCPQGSPEEDWFRAEMTINGKAR